MGDSELDGGVDFNTLLEWIDTGDRDLQLPALEHLCMALLMSDNVDRCFENCPPRQFIPALCRIFLDVTAPVNVLEAAARAVTYYMEVSNECSRRITAVDGAVKAICDRVSLMSADETTNRELVEQCVKVLEHICQRETGLVYEAGGFSQILSLVKDYANVIHKDTLRSAMTVITRLCSKIEPDDAVKSDYSVTLGQLLKHTDLRVSESALRSIAAVVDRFLRKSVDPFEFVNKCELVELLLGLIIEADDNDKYVLSEKPISFISIVLSLLSNLCRGSANATDMVVRSPKLVPVLKAVMTGKDERCVMDGLRLTGMILGLICEGRSSIVKKDSSGKQLDTTLSPKFTQKHKQIIECIRNKDFPSFKKAVESSAVDVNYTDDVGQSLLNWVAAFGTVEMAKFLLDSGANVDGGTRSSSLHYAAIFGRFEIARLLLQNGANPELRDEEGKTPLEKARERHEEGHKQVARLLESPLTKQNSIPEISPVDATLFNSIFAQLVPILCNVNKTAFVSGIRRSSLSLMRKCISHLPSDNLRFLTTQDNFNNEFAENFLGMLETTIDRDDDAEVREQVLCMMKNLLERDLDFWREQIVRLGVHEKVEMIAHEILDEEDEESLNIERAVNPSPASIRNETSAASTPGPSSAGPSSTVLENLEDSTAVPVTIYNSDSTTAAAGVIADNLIAEATSSVLSGSIKPSGPTRIESGIKNFQWHDWRILFVEGITYIWCDYVCIQLNSDGTAAYFLDRKIGQTRLFLTENGMTDTEENRRKFIQDFTFAKNEAREVELQEIFEVRTNNCIGFADWNVVCPTGTRIDILHNDAPGTALRIHYLTPGFSYYFDSDTVETFVGDVTLPTIFATGWVPQTAASSSRVKKVTRNGKVKEVAIDLWENYLKDCKNNMRSELRALRANSEAIIELYNEITSARKTDRVQVERKLYNNLEQVRDALITDNSLSIFEIAHSGIVDALCYGLAHCVQEPNGQISCIFKRVFGGDQVMFTIARKLVLVMEALEKLSVIRYDKPNGTVTGMKLLTKRFRFQLEQANPKHWLQQKLINRTGRRMKADPLCSAAHIKHYLLQMLSKFWFDAERSTLQFVRQTLELKKNKKEMVFEYQKDLDTNGIVFYIGTNGYNEEKWENPAACGLIKVSSCDGRHMPFDAAEEIFSRNYNPSNCHTSDVKGAHFTFDLGLYVYPKVYTLRHATGYSRSALRSWTFEGSSDNRRWYVISRHVNDESLSYGGDTASWKVEANVDIPFRYFRIVQQGYNSSGKTRYLSLSGFELYGHVVDGVSESLPHLSVSRVYRQEGTKYGAGSKGIANQHHWAYKHGRPSGVSDDNSYASHKAALRASLSPYGADNFTTTQVNPLNSPRERTSAAVDAGSSRSKIEKVKQRIRKKSEKTDIPNPIGPLDNSSPPIPLKDRRGDNDGMTHRLRFPSPPALHVPIIRPFPKLVDAFSRPKPDFKTEKGFPKLLAGYMVKNLSSVPNLPEDCLFGRAVNDESNGKVRIMWDSGKMETVNYGSNGVYDVGILINQVKPTRINPELPGPSSAESSSVPTSSATSTISQKSMSTTNLFDEKRARKSVAATNQAASAESLQHQTSSLENLLSRARLFDERIPEVGDEQSPSHTPEPANNEQNLTPSVAASTFGGGSHPVLSTTRRSVDSGPSASQSRGSVSSSASGGTRRTETEGENSVPRHRRWAPDSSSQELFNEEDEVQEGNINDVEDDEYYVYQVANEQNQGDDGDNDEFGSDAPTTPSGTVFTTDDIYSDLLSNYATIFGQDGPPSAERALVEHLSTGGGHAVSMNIRNAPPSGSIPPGVYPSYADALRTVMSHVLEVGDDNEEIEDEIMFNEEYDEEVTDENEEGIDEMISQSLAHVVAEESQNMGNERFVYRTYGSNPPNITNMIWGGDVEGVLLRTVGSDSARLTLRQFGIPRRFYEMLAPSHGRQDPDRQNRGARATKKASRHWDDDFTLKPTYSALIPVFDPRPGRNNVNQIQDVALPSANIPDEELFKTEIGLKLAPTTGTIELQPSDLRLYISGPNIPGIKNATVELLDDEHKILFYIQRILMLTEWQKYSGKNASTKIWEPTFTLIYEVAGVNPSTVETTFLAPEAIFNDGGIDSPVNRALDAIAFMKAFIDICDIPVGPDALISEKLTQKITQELDDPLLVSANSLPEWGEFMLTKHKHLFSLSTRWNYLMATAFGTPRSIVWAQESLDNAHSQNNGVSSRRDDNSDFRIGRLKHERILVPRGEDLFNTAIEVFKFHAVRKSVLEIQYVEEEGTGLGPTLEFYALVASEFQRKARAIWICDDHDDFQQKGEEPQVSFDGDRKPPGYYVRRSGGLFPAPIPPNTAESERACQLFKILGIFLGKVIQDGRIVDIPLSPVLLKLLCIHPDIYDMNGELTLTDFEQIYPEKARFIGELKHLLQRRDNICKDHSLSRQQRYHLIEQLTLDVGHATCTLEELDLTFVVDPPSSVFQYRGHELIEDGANVVVGYRNLDEYVGKVLDFHLNSGIKPQIDALREGFNLVCPLSSLSLFTPSELLTVICGDQSPSWTLDEVLRHAIAKNGYTKQSATFKSFCQVLAEMNGAERKSFLQFATGCTSLPPGGLANLHPPLTIVRKGDCDDGAYPSVNTCVHYLKIPDYSSKEILKERLLSATLQKGFYLN